MIKTSIEQLRKALEDGNKPLSLCIVELYGFTYTYRQEKPSTILTELEKMNGGNLIKKN